MYVCVYICICMCTGEHRREGDASDAGERALSSWGLTKGDKIKVVG